jgi:cytochrome c biogenesis protein CcmG, thiol:disulfide interchange protein DsbE
MRHLALTARAVALALVAALLALLVYHFTARGPSASGLRLAVIWPAGAQRTLATSSLRGRLTVLNFWASWCGPCKREAGLLRRTALQTRGRVTFVGLDVHDSTSDARQFLRHYGVTYTVVKASDGAISTYGVVNLPETIYLDARGHVVARTVGEVTARALTANLARLKS